MAGGGHVATRLGQQATKHNLFHSYQAFNTCYTDTGLWGTYLVTDRMRIDDAMSALQDEWYFVITLELHHSSRSLQVSHRHGLYGYRSDTREEFTQNKHAPHVGWINTDL
jgi:mitochondrial-processing peptidase subunit beta